MKIRYEAEQNKVSEDIEIGTVFSGSLLIGAKSVFLKTYLGIVDLEDPALTWNDPRARVSNYKKLNVELVVLP